MTDMKKLLPIAAVLLLAQACNSFKTSTYEDDLVMPLAEQSADSLYYSASLEYVSGGLKPHVPGVINSTILQQAFDLEDGDGVSVEETANRYRENLIDEYLNENSEPGMPGLLTWEDRIEGCFAGIYKDWINYQLSYYNFRGGAHGIQTVSHIVFDKNTGETVTEDNIFTGDYKEAIAALLRESATASIKADAPELVELLDLPSISPNGNFSVSQDGIEWTFQPYEVGPFALGIVTAQLSWSQLKPYLK